uniref:Uncharacterized protein n=1 Tax=Tetranychus urticae TaxID=32264 RepID=T1KWF0_TETUR
MNFKSFKEDSIGIEQTEGKEDETNWQQFRQKYVKTKVIGKWEFKVEQEKGDDDEFDERASGI